MKFSINQFDSRSRWLLVLFCLFYFFGLNEIYSSQAISESVVPTSEDILSSYYILVGIILIAILSVGIFIRFFSNVSFDSIDSYTSHNALVKKMRVLSLLSMTLIPLVAYYESEALKLYRPDWGLVLVMVIASLIVFILSFNKKLSAKYINIALVVVLTVVVNIVYLMAFQRELNPVLVLEGSILLLFAKVVFQKMKHILLFYIYIILFLGCLIVLILDTDQINLNALSILISTTILSFLVIISMILIERSSINNLTFANKILKSGDLFVLVADDTGKIVYISNPLLIATERTERELLGLGWWNYRNVPGIEKFEVDSNIKSTLEHGSKPKYINKLKTPKGILDIEWTDFALEGKFVMSIGKDITEQLKYQNEVEMLSLVATSVTNGVVIMNKKNELIWNNRQFEELVGLEQRDIKGQDVIEALFLKDTDKGYAIEDMSQIETNKSQTVRFKNKEGDDKFVMLSNSLVEEDYGKEKKILVWTDVSEKWRIEQRYKEIINNAFDNIYTVNEKGRLTYANKRMELNINIPSDDLIGKRFVDLIHPDDKKATIDFYNRQLKRKELYSYLEFRMRGNKRKDIWVGQNVRLVVDKSPERKVIESHVVARDITESRENNEELRRLSYVASKTENIVIIFDSALNIEWVNDTFVKVFGYTLDEVIGKRTREFLNGEKTNEDTLRRIDEKIKKQEHIQEELLNYDKYGNEKWLSISMDPIFDENEQVINYIAVENDISEKKAQELLIKNQHESIIDSLNYASIIQSATLPSISEMKAINQDTFVYYQPKEIIGGDFYAMESITSSKGEEFEIYIVADCTGHGVPGAMLSVLCSSLLKEALKQTDIEDPAAALSYTRNKLVKFLTVSEGHTLNDGMDVCICVVNRTLGYLDYAGANRPLYLLRNNVIKVINGDKQSVGFNHQMKDFTYTRHPFKKGDIVYLFSDGIVDQFGGAKNRKFMSSRFKKLLIEKHTLHVDDQCRHIMEVINDWKGNGEQTDDICLMGVRLNEKLPSV